MGVNFWRFVGAYIKTNWNAAIEYRVSLVSQILGMFINDALWVIFWVLYFTKFPMLNGWELQDVLVLWATVTTSFGLVGGVLSNSLRIPLLVVQGQLDYYLALPKDVLVHVLVSQIRLVNLGDLLFGPILLVLMVDLTPVRVLVFVVSTLLAAFVMLGFFLAAGSLVFFLGNSQTLSGQLLNALLHFSTYPTPIFTGGVKLILFTVIPAGFVASLPVELVRQAHWVGFAQLGAAAAAFMALGVWMFRFGLKRYESGNLMIMRS